MAVTLNANTSTGFIATSDTSGVLQLQTGGTAAVTVDASQNVGIGTASPDLYAGRSTMSINGSTGGIITLQANGTQKLRLFTGASSSVGTLTGALDISTGDASALTFGTNSAERMRIDTSGNVGIGVTNPSAKLTISSGATVNNFFASTTGTNTYTPTASTSLLSANWQIQAGNASGACSGIRLSHGSSFELFLGGVQEAGGAAAFVFQGYDGSSYAERMRITSAGNVAIGTATPQGKLHVVDQVDRTSTTGQFTITGSGYQAAHWLDATAYYIGQNSNSRELRIYSGSSNTVGVRLTAGNNAWQTYSDERMKDIIEPIENAAQKVSTLRTVIGKYKTDEADTRRVFMIAQDVQAVLPEAVTTDAEGMLGMAYDHIVPLLTAAIKEQQAIITSLTDRITALEGTTP